MVEETLQAYIRGGCPVIYGEADELQKKAALTATEGRIRELAGEHGHEEGRPSAATEAREG